VPALELQLAEALAAKAAAERALAEALEGRENLEIVLSEPLAKRGFGPGRSLLQRVISMGQALDAARSPGGCYIAREIPEGHWINELRFEWFARGHGYASTQTQAIPALAKCEPGELYHAATAIMRGASIPIPNGATTAQPPAIVDLAQWLSHLWEWQQLTFPGETLEQVYAHLKEEVRELGDHISDKLEIADCLNLLFCCAFHQGIDPLDALRPRTRSTARGTGGRWVVVGGT
jgi:hypothetical protein